MTFEEFTRAQLPALLRFARVLCLDRGLAEDVVQDVLARAYGRWETIGALEKPDAYVRRMIVNEFLSWRRKWARVVPVAEIPELATASDSAVQQADRALLITELAKLPRRQLAVIVLRFYGGLSDAEIATDLGCSSGTVRAHASRALAALRVELTPEPTLSREF